MKKLITCSALIAFTCALSGCVTRTVTDAPQNRGQNSSGKKYGSNEGGKVVSQKRVWIWQDEFNNP